MEYDKSKIKYKASFSMAYGCYIAEFDFVTGRGETPQDAVNELYELIDDVWNKYIDVEEPIDLDPVQQQYVDTLIKKIGIKKK